MRNKVDNNDLSADHGIGGGGRDRAHPLIPQTGLKLNGH